jgi:TP901 family phage tail tape measure protein
VQVNFDAEIRLDIGPFIKSIGDAKRAVESLSADIDALNQKKLNPKAAKMGSAGGGVAIGNISGDAGAAGLSGSKARIAAAKQELEMQEQLTQAEQINIKTQYEADKMWQKASDARNKDHQLWGRRIDDQIAGEQALRTAESNRIKASMQENAKVVTQRNRDHQTWSRRIDDQIAGNERQGRQFSSSLRAQMTETQRAQRVRESAALSTERNLARERYALYDVAATYTMLAAASGVALAAMARSAIDYERSFVNVARTTDFVSIEVGRAAANMKYELKTLASEIPIAFGQITEIATIGNQLGIAQGAITSFTETVAKFSATTGVSVESTAMAFGRIGELLGVDAADFDRLGSAIAFAGVNAVATEEQILSVTKEIATTAKMAKFTSADVVGLSTALSSLGIAPEAARGSIIRTFAGINAAISEGGEKLDSYAQIAGMTAADFAGTWQSNGQEAFDSFLNGLQSMSKGGQNLDTVLRSIGMKNVRDIQTIQKLGDNYQVYADSIRDANKGFDEGTFLGEAYGQIQDTVASKIQLLVNSWTNLLDTLGQGVVSDAFKALLDNVNSFLVSLNEIARSPVGKFIAGVAVVMTALATALFAVNAASALAQASTKAFASAQAALIGATTKTTLTMRAFDAILLKTGLSARLSAGAMNTLKVGIGAVGTLITGAKWLLIIQAITLGLSELSAAFTPIEDKAEALINGFSGLQEALAADYGDALKKFNDDAGVSAAILKGEIEGATIALDSNEESAKKAAEAVNGMALLTGGAATAVNATTGELEHQNVVLGENYDAWLKQKIAQSPDFQRIAQDTATIDYLKAVGFNFAAANRAAKDNTLEEYMKRLVERGKELNLIEPAILKPDFWMGFDMPLQQITNLLGGAKNEAFLLGAGFGEVAQTDLDYLNESLEDMEDNTKGVSKALRTVVDYANDLRSIFARSFEIRFGQQEALDSIASGWNNIAKKADSARDSIRDANAEIAELTADKSVLQYQLTVAQRYGDEERAAIIRAKIAKIDNNIADKRDKVSEATESLNRSTEGNSDAAIENRKVLMGQVQSYMSLVEMYSKTGLKGKELKAKVKELKEEFKQQGLQAGYSNEDLKPYLKTFDDMRKTINNTPRNVDIEFDADLSPAEQALKEFLAKLKNTSGVVKVDAVLDKSRLVDAAQAQVTYLKADRAILARFNQPTAQIDAQIKAAQANLDKVLNLSSGGFVSGPGSSTSDSIPAMLSNGEFVVRASAVRTYGVDFLNALNQQKVGSFGSSATSAAVSSGSTVAYLSPEDRALLRAVIDRPVNLYTENAKIASSANAGNVILAQRGTN